MYIVPYLLNPPTQITCEVGVELLCSNCGPTIMSAGGGQKPWAQCSCGGRREVMRGLGMLRGKWFQPTLPTLPSYSFEMEPDVAWGQSGAEWHTGWGNSRGGRPTPPLPWMAHWLGPQLLCKRKTKHLHWWTEFLFASIIPLSKNS